MRPFSTAVALLVASTLPTLSTWAQDPEPAPFQEELEVREVLLDVLVTDGEGNVIIGLDRDDFVVEDEGRTVPVESVSFYSNRIYLGAAGATPASAVEADLEAQTFQVPEDRYFVLLFYRPPVGTQGDNRLYLRLPRAGKLAYQWLMEELLPSDHVAVAGFDTRLRLHHDFTRDRGRLGRALYSASRGKAPDSRWPSRSGPRSPGVTLAAFVQDEDREAPSDFVEALTTLAAELEAVPGRKNLIVFGVDVPGYGSIKTEKALDTAIETFNAANVAVYTIGVTRRGHQESLDFLARETGGEYLFRFQDVLDPLRRISRQNSGFYLLSFRSEQPVEGGGYRGVAVRTVSDEFQVRARGGYHFGG